MYATYTTEALVCGSKDSYTSDRSYLLFTKDAGMLWASARSVREERSKQRYALQDFSHIRVSLVRGKTGWKIGSVSALSNSFQSAKTREDRGLVTKVVRQLRQFVRGEDPHPQTFNDTVALFDAVASESDVNKHLYDNYTLRMLHDLGYIAPAKSYQSILETDDGLLSDRELPKEAQKAIDQAQKVSHL